MGLSIRCQPVSVLPSFLIMKSCDRIIINFKRNLELLLKVDKDRQAMNIFRFRYLINYVSFHNQIGRKQTEKSPKPLAGKIKLLHSINLKLVLFNISTEIHYFFLPRKNLSRAISSLFFLKCQRRQRIIMMST